MKKVEEERRGGTFSDQPPPHFVSARRLSHAWCTREPGAARGRRQSFFSNGCLQTIYNTSEVELDNAGICDSIAIGWEVLVTTCN